MLDLKKKKQELNAWRKSQIKVSANKEIKNVSTKKTKTGPF